MTKNPNDPIDLASKLIVSGIHLELTDALRDIVAQKAGRLIRHNDHIIRIRVDIEHDKTRGVSDQFIAKGHVEVSGPDLIASAASEDAYKSLDLLIDKLDRLVRRRHSKDVDVHRRASSLSAGG